MNLKDFVDKYKNKNIDYDSVYGSQCVDLIKQYTYDVFGITTGTFGGSAKTGWENKSDTFPKDVWEKISNDITNINQVPNEGDIVFWGYGVYGHTGIVLKSYEGEDKILVFNQNTGNGDGYGYDDRSRVQEQNYSGILGWYRIKEVSQEGFYKKENEKLKEKLRKINALSSSI